MVGYLLGLCNVDPIKYNLLFERFMDPSRNEMPDIDIDICQDGRQKVIEYVRNPDDLDAILEHIDQVQRNSLTTNPAQ